MSSENAPRVTGALALLCAGLSGAAALAHQLVWIRLATLHIGATYPAISAVLAGFMLGLGVGSLIGGALADGPSPKRAYIFVELGIAGGALALYLLFPHIGGVAEHPLVLGGMLLPVTALIGATFPILSRLAYRGGAAQVPGLYAANVLGAAAGALLGGLVLPYAVGLAGSVGAAVAMNAIVAVLASGLREREGRAPKRPTAGRLRSVSTWLVLCFVVGWVGMVSEICWTRALMQVDRRAWRGLQEPTEVLTAILVLVLLGNGIGAAVSAAVGSRRRLALVLGALGVALAASAHSGWLPEQWQPAAVVPPALLLGSAFPILAQHISAAEGAHGQRMGWVWAGNTAGSVIGSLGAGFWLLPALGPGWPLLACALLMAAAATALGARWLSALAFFCIIGVYLGDAPDPEVRATYHGLEATSLVKDTEQGRWLVTNGRAIRPGQGAAQMISGLQELGPMQTVLLVGFGTGHLAQALLESPGLQQLTIVEIDDTQYAAARWFGTASVLDSPKVDAHVGDALQFVAGRHEAYDAIVLDGWGPEACPSLYTHEFHSRARRALRPEGTLWAKFVMLDDDTRRLLLWTAAQSHPYVYARKGVLIGRRTPLSGVPPYNGPPSRIHSLYHPARLRRRR